MTQNRLARFQRLLAPMDAGRNDLGMGFSIPAGTAGILARSHCRLHLHCRGRHLREGVLLGLGQGCGLGSMETAESSPETEVLSVHDRWKYLRSSAGLHS